MKTIKQLLFLLVLVAMISSGCRKYLDAKPDKSLEVPASLQDLQAMMDDNSINKLMPYAADIGSDDYFVNYSDWSAFKVQPRNNYVWDAGATNDRDWQYGYQFILMCNVALEQAAKLDAGAAKADLDNVQGQAYFFRGYLLYQLANIFTAPYVPSSAAGTPGLPLKLKSDINEKIVRSSLAETYQQVISDLKNAAARLPVVPKAKTRGSKPAAYAALARACLYLQDYQDANLYADSSLALSQQLTDYNTLDTAAINPFPIFNGEVEFHATSNGVYDVVDPYYARVDTDLFKTYLTNDLRKQLFYTYAENGHYAFKGDYYGGSYGPCFAGVATDEVLLIRSESFARLGKVKEAITDLNTLLTSRFTKGTYIPYSGTMSADAALRLILQERRKELAFRSGLRWSDLKRLNQDSRFSKTAVRKLSGQTYSLLPGDKRYAMLIPVSVIQLSGIAQNPR